MPAPEGKWWERGARYAPELSHPVLRALSEALPTAGSEPLRKALAEAVAATKDEQAAFFSDLICVLNGKDDLPWLAGAFMSCLYEPKREGE